MELTCDICKTNKDQEINACPFIDKSKRRKPDPKYKNKKGNIMPLYPFDLYGNPFFGVNKCIVGYYETNKSIMNIYDSLQNTDITKVKSFYRLIYLTVKEYYNLKNKKLLEDLEDKKNG